MVCSSQEVAALLTVPIRIDEFSYCEASSGKEVNEFPSCAVSSNEEIEDFLLLSLPGMEVDDFLALEPPRARPLAHNLRKLSLRASRNLHGTFTGCNKVFVEDYLSFSPPLV